MYSGGRAEGRRSTDVAPLGLSFTQALLLGYPSSPHKYSASHSGRPVFRAILNALGAHGDGVFNPRNSRGFPGNRLRRFPHETGTDVTRQVHDVIQGLDID